MPVGGGGASKPSRFFHCGAAKTAGRAAARKTSGYGVSQEVFRSEQCYVRSWYFILRVAELRAGDAGRGSQLLEMFFQAVESMTLIYTSSAKLVVSMREHRDSATHGFFDLDRDKANTNHTML